MVVQRHVMDQPEPTTQGRSQTSGPRGGPYQGEGLELEGFRCGMQPRVDGDINMEIFHSGIQELLDRCWQTMYFIDEQHISGLEF